MSSEDFMAIVQSRLNELESQRAKVQSEMEKSLMPLNAAISELRLLLARVNGGGTLNSPPSNYVASATVPPPSDVVLSPKSKTPVPGNAAVLRMALHKK